MPHILTHNGQQAIVTYMMIGSSLDHMYIVYNERGKHLGTVEKRVVRDKEGYPSWQWRAFISGKSEPIGIGKTRKEVATMLIWGKPVYARS